MLRKKKIGSNSNRNISEYSREIIKPKPIKKSRSEQAIIDAKKKYDKVHNRFYDGRLIVFKDGRCGYIDIKGKEVIPLKYNICWQFNDGKAQVFKHTKEVIIDVKGREIDNSSDDSSDEDF